jgi:hypothetical protein
VSWRSDFAGLSTSRRVTINALCWLGAVLWFLAVFWADSSKLAFVLIAVASLAIIASVMIFRASVP